MCPNYTQVVLIRVIKVQTMLACIFVVLVCIEELDQVDRELDVVCYLYMNQYKNIKSKFFFSLIFLCCMLFISLI